MNGPTPFDGFFDALEARLRIPCPREPDGDAAASTETRITWVRDGAPKWEKIPYHRARSRVIGRYAHPWLATIYGSSDLEVCNLLAALTAACDKLLGAPQGSCELGDPGDEDYAPEAPGYELTPGKIEPFGDSLIAASWTCEVNVILRQPVDAATRGTAQGSARLEAKPDAPAELADPTEVVWPE